MTGLDDFEEGKIPEKAVVFMFVNPEHEDMEEYITNPMKAEEYYENAERLRRQLGEYAENFVGEFITAAIELEQHDNPEPLDELVDRLKEDGS